MKSNNSLEAQPIIIRPRTGMRASRWLQPLRFALFPAVCAVCDGAGRSAGRPRSEGPVVSGEPRDLCAGCAADLRWNNSCCRVCSDLLPVSGAADLRCGRCQRQPPAYDYSIAPLLYQAPLDHLIRQLKFHGRLAYSPLLAQLLQDGLRSRLRDRPLPTALIPVPLHPRRLRQRGFNQALEIARPLAAGLGVPLLSRVASRVRNDRPQAQLSQTERGRNLRHAFAVRGSLAGQSVAIIDDVMTSGATLNELALTLRGAGAESVEAWVCARTVRSDPF